MPDVKMYHNPRCSKSRQTLEVLNDNGVEPEIILYLENPPSEDELRSIISMLGFGSAMDLIRKKEDLFSELNVAVHAGEEDELIRIEMEVKIVMAKKVD